MKDIYYDTIFKRKSFHLFRGVGQDSITQDDILEICMEKRGLHFTRSLFVDDGSDRELTKSAEYRLILISD